MRNQHRLEPGDASVPTNPDGLAVACADAADALAPPIGASGNILRCAKIEELDAPGLEARSRAYLGDTPRRAYTSGARVYRVLYRTMRATVPASAGVASALVYLPTSPRAARVPVIVATHGAFGEAAGCAPSQLVSHPDRGGLYATFVSQVHPLVGAGFAVIAPDLSGFAAHGAAGNPRPALLSSEDEAYAVLDASRALRRLVPDRLTGDVVLTGQSAGGHATLSALARSETYGAGGTIVGTVLFAPVWVNPQPILGGLLAAPQQFPIAAAPNFPNAASVWYFLAHAELIDGPAFASDAFADGARAAMVRFFDSACWTDRQPQLEAIGPTAADLYAPAFRAAVAAPLATGACPADEPGKTVCERWTARFRADFPHLPPAAARVPTLLAYGGSDDLLVPPLMQCTVNRLAADGVTPTVCIDPQAGHGGATGIAATRGDYAADWIASVTLGAPAPAACSVATFDFGVSCPLPPE
jgi:dienelactone hydrolase